MTVVVDIILIIVGVVLYTALFYNEFMKHKGCCMKENKKLKTLIIQ